MGSSTMMISQITPSIKNWTARVTITEDIPALTCATGKKLKRYILTDEEGNEVTATVFSYHIPILEPILQLFKVYDITNAQVKAVDPKYKILNNPYQWTLQRETMIRPVPEIGPTLRYFRDGLTPFGVIARNTNSNPGSVDIMGVILAYEAPTTVSSLDRPKSVQRFTFIDKEKIPIYVTLWEEMALTQGPILMEAASSLSVVVAKRLTITTYKGIALSAKNSSSFAINPPVESAIALKSWIDSKNEFELQELLIDRSIAISKEMVERGDIKIYTVSEIDAIDKNGRYWVREFLQISEEDQRFYYIGCSSYSVKSSAKEAGIPYTCTSCLKEVTTQAKAIVVMNVFDEDAAVKILAMGEITEQILQSSAVHIYNLAQLGESYDVTTIRPDFDGKIFRLFLSRSYSKQNESQRKMLLITYCNDISSESTGQSSNQHLSTDILTKAKSVESPHSPLSSLKRQMSGITITQDGAAKKKLFLAHSGTGDSDQKGTSEDAS